MSAAMLKIALPVMPREGFLSIKLLAMSSFMRKEQEERIKRAEVMS